MEKVYVHDTELFVATNWGYQKVRGKFGEKSLGKQNGFIDISSGYLHQLQLSWLLELFFT
jgi:uncharacterized protein (DUF952 family)